MLKVIALQHQYIQFNAGLGVCKDHFNIFNSIKSLFNRVPSPSRPRSQRVINFEGAIKQLSNERHQEIETGVAPETNLMPHSRIKLDITIKAFTKDLDQILQEAIRKNNVTKEKILKVYRLANEYKIKKMQYEMKRLPHAKILEIFEIMIDNRDDMHQLEVEVRQENNYDIVDWITEKTQY